MTKRLQVLLDDAELRTIQRIARREKLTTAEWVRRRLREDAGGPPFDVRVRTEERPECRPGVAEVAIKRAAQEGHRLTLHPVAPLALGSEDPQRFFLEMGTLYLRRIGELAAGALAART